MEAYSIIAEYQFGMKGRRELEKEIREAESISRENLFNLSKDPQKNDYHSLVESQIRNAYTRSDRMDIDAAEFIGRLTSLTSGNVLPGYGGKGQKTPDYKKKVASTQKAKSTKSAKEKPPASKSPAAK